MTFCPVDHLLDETFRPAHGVLLAHEEFRASAAHGFGDEQHDADAEQHHESEVDAGDEHRHQQGDDADKREQTLRHALGYELTERVHVVGVIAHYVAVRVRVEVAHGKSLHFVEHVLADVFEEALRDDRHKTGVHERTQYARGINARHDARNGVKRVRHIVEAACYAGLNDVVDEDLQEYGRAYARHCRHRDAYDDEEQLPLVIMRHVTEEPAEDLHRAAFLNLHSSARHYSSPPSAEPPSSAAPAPDLRMSLSSAALAPMRFCE